MESRLEESRARRPEVVAVVQAGGDGDWDKGRSGGDQEGSDALWVCSGIRASSTCSWLRCWRRERLEPRVRSVA